METFELKKFYFWQKKLDQKILEKHNLTLKKTFKLRLLALLVELGEFANETRLFKFWSKNKKIDNEKLIFEYVDCFHFFLSLGNYFNDRQRKSYSVKKQNSKMTTVLLKTFQETSRLMNNFSLLQYEKAFQHFLNLSFFYQINNTILKKYYLCKYKENINRQENKY